MPLAYGKRDCYSEDTGGGPLTDFVAQPAACGVAEDHVLRSYLSLSFLGIGSSHKDWK